MAPFECGCPAPPFAPGFPQPLQPPPVLRHSRCSRRWLLGESRTAGSEKERREGERAWARHPLTTTSTGGSLVRTPCGKSALRCRTAAVLATLPLVGAADQCRA